MSQAAAPLKPWVTAWPVSMTREPQRITAAGARKGMVTFMENISAKTIRRRGRPCTIQAQERDIQRQYGTSGLSRRQQDNHLYETRAMGQFMDDPEGRFHWLVSDHASINQGKGTIRSTMLSELGRIDDPDDREVLALHLLPQGPAPEKPSP